MPRPALVVLALVLLAAASPPPAYASASGIVVSELRFRGPAGASDEFVELVNAGGAPVDVSGWRLQACSASTGTAVTRATVPAGTELAPGRHLLVAHATGYTGTVTADLTYGTGIADGGGVRLVTADGAHVDGAASVAAPTSECREGSGLALPTDDSEASLERLGGSQDTDDNANDFAGAVSDPQNAASLPPALSVDDVAVVEGGVAVFTVSLSVASGRPVTVEVTTADGSAAAPGDYTAAVGTVTLPAGALGATFAVATVADGVDEPDETFRLELSSPTRATVADGSGQATILDADETPSLSIAGTTVVEGGSASFAVTLSAPSAFPVSVAYATADGSATAPGDYAATSGTLVLAPGETSSAIAVATAADDLDEPDESFSVVLSSPQHAALAVDTAHGTIVDDDEPPAPEPDAGTPGRLLAAGRVGAHGTLVALVSVRDAGAAPRGLVTYVAPRFRLVSTTLARLVVDGRDATVTGTARVGGALQPFELRVEGRTVTLSWPGGTASGRLRGALHVSGD